MSDDELAGQLRSADPAAKLAPLSPDRVKRLLETAMTNTTLDKPSAPLRHRRLIFSGAGLAAAAAAAVFAIGVFLGATHGGTVTSLVNQDGEAMCAPPTADDLSRAPLAFEGRVKQIKDGVVTLAVTRSYAGKPADLVEIHQSDNTATALIGDTVFETGGTYLIAASDGKAWACGLSGLETPKLQALYEQAF
ncbi:MAG: hypothetical protein QOE51_5013 [Actinoplanes sp.]|nr:hypothetical protein [Actinoplanes sp.]